MFYTNKIIIAVIYLWTGFVCAISFMEAWLKFRAEGVTRSVGLSIGRLVFSALNKVEIVFAILTVILILSMKEKFCTTSYLQILVVPILIVVLQTVYLLPVLDERVELIIQNKTVPHSNMHLTYVIMEVIKVGALLWAGSKVLNIK